MFDVGLKGAPAQDVPASESPAPENAPERTGGEPPAQDASMLEHPAPENTPEQAAPEKVATKKRMNRNSHPPRPRLDRVEADVMGNLHRLGVPSSPLDGRERLALLHGQMHSGRREPFHFAWTDISKTGMGTKDFITPSGGFDFRGSRVLSCERFLGAASYLQILASELSDRLLREVLELDAELTVTMHIQTVDQLKAIKTIKGKIYHCSIKIVSRGKGKSAIAAAAYRAGKLTNDFDGERTRLHPQGRR